MKRNLDLEKELEEMRIEINNIFRNCTNNCPAPAQKNKRIKNMNEAKS